VGLILIITDKPQKLAGSQLILTRETKQKTSQRVLNIKLNIKAPENILAFMKITLIINYFEHTVSTYSLAVHKVLLYCMQLV